MIPKNVSKLVEIFNNAGFEIRLVGGAVRDIFLNNIPKDWDLATNATPEKMKTLSKNNNIKIILDGEKHGTIRFIYNHQIIEITTLRIDKNQDGRHATVEFHNDWKLDAARRDFTFNALSMNIKTGEIYDYFNGKEDLKKGIIRFVGNPDKRIKEDYLRILRFFRFGGKFDVFKYDDLSLISCINNREGLHKISQERKWVELSKIFSAHNRDKITELMFYGKIFEAIDIPWKNI